MLRAVVLFVLLIAGAFLAERLDPGLPPPPAAEIVAVRAAQWRMLLGFFLFVSLGKYQNFTGFSSSMWQADGSSYLLVGMTMINPKLNVKFDRFIKFGTGHFFYQLQGLGWVI